MHNQESFRRGRHVVFHLRAHLVFVTKYRKRIISDAIWDTLDAAFNSASEKLGCSVVESNHEGDHVHVLLDYPPTLAIATAVNSLKGVSARLVRSQHAAELDGKMWGEHFWSPSYFATSCGGAPLETIQAYIRNQRKVALKGEVSTQETY